MILALLVSQFSLIFTSILMKILPGQGEMIEIWTIKEVSAFLKIKEKTAYRLVAEGKIPGFKVGGSWRFKRDEIEAWIDDKMTIKSE